MEDETVVPAQLSRNGQYVLESLIPEWVGYFTDKSQDYADDAENMGLGYKGSFSDMWRKMGKLKRALWDDQELRGEQPRELLQDVIGHCFLIIAEMDNPSVMLKTFEQYG